MGEADAGDWRGGFAVRAAAGDMVRCRGLPIVLALLHAQADRLDTGESVHAIFLLLAVATSALALVSGWRRHGALVPVIVGVVGLVLMATGIAFASSEFIETAITVTGSLLLVAAHLANWRGRRRSAVASAR